MHKFQAKHLHFFPKLLIMPYHHPPSTLNILILTKWMPNDIKLYSPCQDKPSLKHWHYHKINYLTCEDKIRKNNNMTNLLLTFSFKEYNVILCNYVCCLQIHPIFINLVRYLLCSAFLVKCHSATISIKLNLKQTFCPTDILAITLVVAQQYNKKTRLYILYNSNIYWIFLIFRGKFRIKENYQD